MFYPARTWEDLGELFFCRSQYSAFVVEEHCA
jgi:hypothetical protein